jgi:hypothetical protein
MRGYPVDVSHAGDERLLRDSNEAPETVYVSSALPDADGGWLVTSLDVGSWCPLTVGDRLVALHRSSPAEFVVEVVEVDVASGEVFYRLRHISDLDPATEPGLDDTRSWLRHS